MTPSRLIIIFVIFVLLLGISRNYNVSVSGQTITVIDDLNDFSKTYSHTGTFSFDGSSSSYFRGDTSRLARAVASTSPPSSIVYNHSSIESFIVTTYFWLGESINHFAFYSSQDGSNWTSISPNISNEGGDWTRVVYSGLLPPQANFLKVEFPSSGISWTPQVSRIMLNVAPSLPSPPTNLSMALIDPINSIGGSPGKDLRSRNCNWSLPLLGLPGRAGMDLGLTLSLNSLVYTRAGSVMHFDPLQGYPAPGFSLGFPEIHNSFTNTDAGVQSYLLSMPSGSRVEFRQINTNVYEAVDSSYMRLTHDPVNSVFILYTTDGTQFRFEDVTGLGDYKCKQIKDRQGNYITITYGSLAEIRTVIDTLGRPINFNYDTFNHLISITQDWGGQTHTWATFAYGTQTIQTNFDGLTLNGTTNGADESVLQRVGLADGTVYSFEYNTYAQVKTIRKNAPKNSNPINFPGDYVERAYTTYGLPSNANDPQTDCPRATSRTDGAYDWHSDVKHFYAGGLNHGWGKVTFPDGTIYKEFFATTGWQRGLTTRTEHLSGGVVKKSTELEWTQDNTGVSYRLNPRVTQTIVSDDANNFLWTTIGYTSFGLVSDVHEYGSGTTPLRRKHIDYNLSAVYTDRRLIGLPSAVYLYDGNNTLFSKIKYEYDQNPNLYLQHPGPTVQHDTANYGLGFGQGRGNLNIVTRWNVDDPNNASQASETETGYNTSGSVIFTRDPLNHQTTVTYDNSFSDGQNRNTFAYTTTMTNADNFSSSVQYAYHSGAVTRTQDPKGAAVARTYDAVGRIARITNEVNGAYTRYAYTTDQHFVLSLTTVNDFSEFIQVKGFDGHDRLRVTVSDHPTSVGQSKAQFNAYDEMGRLVGQTNPIEVDSAWQPAGDDAAAGWVGTSQAYDWQGRPTVTTNQDGTTKEILYGGCGCAGGQVIVTRDEVGRRQETTYDILQRPKTTQTLFIQPKDQPLDGNGAVYSTTTNTYNVRDQVTNVNVKDEASGVSQNTQMVYDGHGRLKQRWLPIYLGNPQSPTPYDSYEYNSDDTLMKQTDPRGASVTYGYNNRQLVTSITYGVPAGVAPTSNITFGYDEAGNRTSMVDGLGIVTYHYDMLSRMDWETRYFNDLGQNYTLSYEYNLAGGIKKVTDPWGASVTYELNKAGETTGITGVGYADINQWTNRTVSQFASNVRYRAWGAIKSFTNGNFATEKANFSIGYNNRLQLTHFDESGDFRSDLNHHADGRIKDVIHAPGLSRFDRHYNYDHVGSLTNATTGDSQPQTTPYHLNFTHDVWGNTTSRTGWYWSQSVPALPQTYNNNRNTGWTYDAAGNVIDASRDAKLDAAGRQVSSIEGTVLIFHLNEHGYDGDGQHARFSSTLINSNPVASKRNYQVRSSVLGGVVIAEIIQSNLWETPNETRKSFVYLNGQLIAYQITGNIQALGSAVVWVYRHPAIGSLAEHNRLNVDGQPQDAYYAYIMTDPTGAKIESVDPGTIPPPEDPWVGPWKAGHGFGLGFGGGTGDCYMDGVRTDCSFVMSMLDRGYAVEAPWDNTTGVWNPGAKGGRGAWELARFHVDWNNGFFGFVPVGANYGGDGTWTWKGRPRDDDGADGKLETYLFTGIQTGETKTRKAGDLDSAKALPELLRCLKLGDPGNINVIPNDNNFIHGMFGSPNKKAAEQAGDSLIARLRSGKIVITHGLEASRKGRTGVPIKLTNA